MTAARWWLVGRLRKASALGKAMASSVPDGVSCDMKADGTLAWASVRIMTVVLLRPIKGALVALQWSIGLRHDAHGYQDGVDK